MFKYIIIISLFFSSCSYKNHSVKDINKYITTVDYGNFSKDSVLDAAKRAFSFTNKDFIVDSYRNSLSVRKTTFNTLTTNVVDDIFILEVEEKDNNTIAKFHIKRIFNSNDSNFFYLDLGDHKMFYKRLNFFLDIEKDWPRCMSNDEDAILKTFCTNLSSIFISSPTDKDKIKKPYIYQRIQSKNIVQITKDILLIDNFEIRNKKNDILDKEDELKVKNKIILDSNYDNAINIDDILDKIKKETNKSLNKK